MRDLRRDQHPPPHRNLYHAYRPMPTLRTAAHHTEGIDVTSPMPRRIESDDAAKAHRESQAVARERQAVKALLARVVASCGLPTVMQLLAEVVEEGGDTV